MGKTVVALFISLVFGLFDAKHALAQPLVQDASALCRELTAKAEARYRLPHRLLAALSLAESGRTDLSQAARVSWPWTINALGSGRFFPDKAGAVREVKRLQAKGVRNIDVGCMQVNLGHHPAAFATIEDAFDPAMNVDYAARFVKNLHARTRSWTQAIAFYHSALPARYLPYRRKVMAIWGEEIKLAAQERRQLALANWHARRQTQGGAPLRYPIVCLSCASSARLTLSPQR
jgi:hypothetical protein